MGPHPRCNILKFTNESLATRFQLGNDKSFGGLFEKESKAKKIKIFLLCSLGLFFLGETHQTGFLFVEL
jgi:hypothetical protein